jgi:hypothetical protein
MSERFLQIVSQSRRFCWLECSSFVASITGFRRRSSEAVAGDLITLFVSRRRARSYDGKVTWEFGRGMRGHGAFKGLGNNV